MGGGGGAISTFNVFKQTRHLTMLQLSGVMFHNLQITSCSKLNISY